MYIGYESFKIYRLEYERDPKVGKYANSIWIYKKNSVGKLYLSYMTREWVGARRLPENVKNTLINSGQKGKEFYPVSFRHELFVTKLIEDKSKLKPLDLDDYNRNYISIGVSIRLPWTNYVMRYCYIVFKIMSTT